MNKNSIIIASFTIIALLGLTIWDSLNADIFLFKAFMAAQIPSLIAFILISLRTMHLSDVKMGLGNSLQSNGLAITIGNITPARLGELLKPFYLHYKLGMPISQGIVIVIKERIWDVLTLAILGLLIIYGFGEIYGQTMLKNASYTLGIMALIGAITLFFIPQFFQKIPYLKKLETSYNLRLENSLFHHLGTLAVSVSIWVASFTIFVVAYKFSGLTELSLTQLVAVFAISTLGLLIGVTPGSVGTYEGVTTAMLVSFGISWDNALAFALLFRFCWLAVPAIALLNALYYNRDILTKWQARKLEDRKLKGK